MFNICTNPIDFFDSLHCSLIQIMCTYILIFHMK